MSGAELPSKAVPMAALPLPKMSLAEFMAKESQQRTRNGRYRGEVFAMEAGPRRLQLADGGAVPGHRIRRPW